MNEPARDLHAGRLENEAREIAGRYQTTQTSPRILRALAAAPRLARWFERVEEVAQKGVAEQKIAEWLLDNAHQVRRAVRQVSWDLPGGYYRRLPSIGGGKPDGLPRVYHLARSLATLSSLQLDLATVVRFVAAHQEITELRIAELWALPTMLRIVCLEIICDVAARAVSLPPPFDAELEPLLTDFADAERVGRAIRALSAISSILWSDFVDRTSVIEAVLGEDPARVYSRSDRETRDRYRRAVEELADLARRTERDVARAAVIRAQAFHPGTSDRTASGNDNDEEPVCADDESYTAAPYNHVGHWLIGHGRDEFEKGIGIRATTSVRLRRAMARRASTLYLTGILATTAGALVVPAALLHADGATAGRFLVGMLAAAIPACSLAISIVQWFACRVVPPRVLPKLDFDSGIPTRWRTAVVVPAMLTSTEETTRLLDMLARHFLSNQDPGLVFVLLSDFADAPSQHMPGDDALFERAARGIRDLNARHPDRQFQRFQLAHRGRVYNPAEDCWMGWERKRGKIEEWNRYLRGDRAPVFRREGDDTALRSIRFVITLDSDTVLPTGAASRLAGVLAHPLNRPRFHPDDGRLIDGYTIIQPRVEITPEAAGRSAFSAACAGDSTIDIYSRAVSDVYQDLFATGIYVGKGIYDVDAFARSLEGRVPENAIASHDLFEGAHGRAALASDIVIYEDFPPHYLAFVRRLHRWIRGDWQLLPWLGRNVPARGGGYVPTRLGTLERWFILDNLRRSLLSPALLTMMVAGWLWLPGSIIAWTALAVGTSLAHGLLDLLLELVRRRPFPKMDGDAGGIRQGVTAQLRRVSLLIAFLPFESWIVIDAVARTLVRMMITRRHLLQWQTASQIAFQFEAGVPRATVWREMAAAPAITAVLGTAIVAWRPEALPAALPLLVLWLVSPEIAHRISRPRRHRTEELTRNQVVFIRRLARRTWLFFETFVVPEEHWLPPDNYQETPSGVVDHRTSPTNIGMLLLSTSSAWDLGYIGPRELTSRLGESLDNLTHLERYRGHLLNWYDTRTYKPLLPAYVSTVDSGNLAAALIAVSETCVEVSRSSVLSPARWDGLMDALGWLEAALARLVPGLDPPGELSLARCAASIRHRAASARDDASTWPHTLVELCERDCADFDRLLLETIEAHKALLHLPALREIRIWLDRVHRHLRAMHADLDSLLAWLPVLDGYARRDWYDAEDDQLVARLRELLPPTVALSLIPERCAQARAWLSAVPAGGQRDAARWAAWSAQLDSALSRSADLAAALTERCAGLTRACEKEALTPEFGFLYDADQHLFHIGYNVTAGVVDPHHYDLLTSECRLASYIAIAKGDVPVRHWLHLGRPLTRTAGQIALLSWGGTMFEYLMPRLLLQGGDDDLLSQSERAAIDTQRAYARRHGVPWGVSESGFAARDAEHNYQYRAFGVPALGIKRELGDDIVVAPYATALALPLRPAASAENLARLCEMGALGEFGLHEAIDFTPPRVPSGRKFEVVRSYMSHHQGMVLTALDNYLSGFPLVRRFHEHPLMRTAELLLRERVPVSGPLEFPSAEAAKPAPKDARAPRTLYPWRPVRAGAFPELHAIGNGRFTTIFSESGSGGMQWMGRALTHWVPDVTLDDRGVWIYVRDLDDGELWSVGRQPVSDQGGEIEVVFHPHMVELHHRHHEIGIHLETYVVPSDDVEIRRLTVVNGSDRPRRLAIATYGEVVLAPPEQHRQHPAFSKLFVRGEPVQEVDGVLFERRPRGEGELPPVLLHRLVADSANVRLTRVELSRERFLGRLGSPRRPAWRDPAATTHDHAGHATDLDPIASVEATVELAAGATERLAFSTMVADSRMAVLGLAGRYDSEAALAWALADATTESAREAARFDLDPGRLSSYQRLLSIVLQPHAALRCSPDLIAANVLSQSDLWRMGISGDLPILLLVMDNTSDTGLLADLVHAHALWHRRGVAVDLVVLHSEPAGYEDAVAHTIQDLLERFHAVAYLRKKGGVHLVRSDQVRPEDLVLLRVASRAQLDAARSLDEQLHDAHRLTQYAPPFVPAEPSPLPATAPAVEQHGDLLFDNGTGGFSADGKQYVIHVAPAVTTPAPWCNVLANRRFGTLVTESGGGYTWSGNASERRLSSWRNDPVCDPPSEALYIRDEETGALWMPMMPGTETPVEVRHGSGSTSWERRDHGLEQKIEVFVAGEDPVKVVRLHLRDLAGRPRRLTVTSYVEWVLGTVRETGSLLLVTDYDLTAHALLARNPWNPVFADRVAFLVSDADPHGFTTDRGEFLGREGSLRQPAALSRWGLGNTARPGPDPCAALQIHLEIPPAGCTDAHFALGEGRDRADAIRLAGRWRDTDTVENAWASVHEARQELLGTLIVRTPEPALDVMVNHWLLHQSMSARILGRTGYYQSSGAFGFRDQLQDVLAFLLAEPEMAREHILECAHHQFAEGDVLHWWHPTDGRGLRTRCSDDLLWLPFVTSHYVEATGDSGILDETVPFLVAPSLAQNETDRYGSFEHDSRGSTLFEHCTRALEHGMTQGQHGLPLMGAGDWNDGMNRVGKDGRGESVWLAWFGIATAHAFARVCALRGVHDLAAAWHRRAEALAERTEAAAWDGSWYRRAYDDEGRPWGSAECDECRIDSIAQSWAVLSGSGDPDRARTALDSAWRELVRQNDGVARLLWPPFDRTAREPGYIKAYPPGIRENGGQYSHAAAWLAMAFARAGDGERAVQVLRLLNPIEHSRDADGVARYRVEPYVVAADILSTPPYTGRGGWTWYTGAAAWTYRAAVEGVLGLRLSAGSLQIEPSLPPSWAGFEAVLRTRSGGTLELQVENAGGGGDGEMEILVDGRMIAGNVVGLPRDEQKCSVRVRLGHREPQHAATGSC